MLSAKWHRHIFLFGLIALASGMMFGTVPTSIPQGILGANWLLEKNYGSKWQQLKTNKIFWVLVSLFLIHIIGLAYTENMTRGLEDIKNKLPLIVLPIIFFSTRPLEKKEFDLLFGFFFLSVVVSSVCCFMVYCGFTKKVIIDIRKASVFMSHIRFSLFIAFAILGMIYGLFTKKNVYIKLLFIASILWLLFFMNKLELATGFLCLLVVGPILVFTYSLKKLTKTISVSILVLIVLFASIICVKAINSLDMFEKNPANKANTLYFKNRNGSTYFHDTALNSNMAGLAENGNLITINMVEPELESVWPKISALGYRDKDKKGNEIRFTIFRYLASKGLTKDSLGLTGLSQQDILNIENGITNYKYSTSSGLSAKWRELVWEYTNYKRGQNPSGHTITMRLEFWKTACYIIGKYPVFGVGTGDVQNEFNKAYEETNSKLNSDWRLRCHNQYLAITVAFGIIGLLIFFIYLFYPAIALRKKLHFLYWPFFLIALLSFITEDTLETQSGVTFFIFFQAFFLWLASYKLNEENIFSTIEK